MMFKKRAEAAGLGGRLLVHEVAFLVFFGLTAARLFLSGTGGQVGLRFLALFLGPVALYVWFRRKPAEVRLRVRLLAYVVLMGISYFALRPVPSHLPAGNARWLQWMDGFLIGGNASVRLDPLVHPVLTDFFSLSYLAFFPYMVAGIYHYGRGSLALFTRFSRGLFTVYGLGFVGYTLIPAAGPYLDMPEQFSHPLRGGWLTDAYDAIVLPGTNQTDCFPCLHVAITAFILFFDRRHYPVRFRWMLLPCLCIWISTIYLRQHYFSDVLSGGLLAAFALWLVRERPGGGVAGGEFIDEPREISINAPAGKED